MSPLGVLHFWTWVNNLLKISYGFLIKRPRFAKIEYIGLDGVTVKADLTTGYTRLFLHEYDHLLGLTFHNRQNTIRQIKVVEELTTKLKFDEFLKNESNHLIQKYDSEF